MNKGSRALLFLLGILLLLSLACTAGLDLPFGLGEGGDGLSQEEIAAAATRAAEAAATAAAVAGQQSQAAATSAAAALATTQAESAAAPATGNSLEQKLANIQPDANGNFAVTITEADLNEFIAGQGGRIDTESLKAQDIKFDINGDYLQLTGDVTEPLALPLEIRLRPVISGERLQFDLISASAGLFPIPDSMLDVIETVANSELSRALVSLPSGVSLQNATLGEGEFTVFGHQN